MFTCVQRLDSESVKAWEHHLGPSKEPPIWKQLSDFLMTRLLSLQVFEKSRPLFQSRTQSARFHSVSIRSSNNEPEYTCLLCMDKHQVSRCPKYQQKTLQNRRQFVQTNRLCFNCLGRHRVLNCSSSKHCPKYGNQHHSTLYQVSVSNLRQIVNRAPTHSSSAESANSRPSTADEPPVTVNHAHSSIVAMKVTVLLANAQVRVTS